jgi:hypothetical protein
MVYRTIQTTVLAGPFVALGIMLIVIRGTNPSLWSQLRQWLWLIVAVYLVYDLICTLLMLRLVRRVCLPAPIRIDFSERLLTLPPAVPASLFCWMKGGASSPRQVPFGDTAAVQICKGMSPLKSFWVFQIIVVLKQPPGERVLLMEHANEAALRDDARSLAKLLNLPLLDHTSER